MPAELPGTRHLTSPLHAGWATAAPKPGRGKAGEEVPPAAFREWPPNPPQTAKGTGCKSALGFHPASTVLLPFPVQFPSPFPVPFSAVTAHPPVPPGHTPHAERRAGHLGHGNLIGNLGYFEPHFQNDCRGFFSPNSHADRLITVKTNASSTRLTSFPPLELQRNLCLAPTGAWHHDTPQKSQKMFLAFHRSIFPLEQSVSQILLLSSQLPSSSFTLCEQLHTSVLKEPVLPPATKRVHWLLRSYSTGTIFGEDFCFDEVCGITWTDFCKLEVHLLKLKTKFGSASEKRSSCKKKKKNL